MKEKACVLNEHTSVIKISRKENKKIFINVIQNTEANFMEYQRVRKIALFLKNSLETN